MFDWISQEAGVSETWPSRSFGTIVDIGGTDTGPSLASNYPYSTQRKSALGVARDWFYSDMQGQKWTHTHTTQHRDVLYSTYMYLPDSRHIGLLLLEVYVLLIFFSHCRLPL